MWRLFFWYFNGIQTNFCVVSVADRRTNWCAHLDWEADRDEEEVRGGEAGQERVGGRLEGGLPHDGQDDQHVARHTQTEGEAAQVLFCKVSGINPIFVSSDQKLK